MKKFIHTRLGSFILALVLVCSLAAPAAAAQFTDVPVTHWAYNDIMACAEMGIVTGFEDGSFLPNDPVTDTQLIVMLTRTFYNDQVEAAAKSKPAGSSWSWPYTYVAEQIKISNTLTISDTAMNRNDMAMALCNVINAEGKLNLATSENLSAAMTEIKDYSSIPANRQGAVAICYALGILTGMEDGSFSGEQNMNRAQACTVIMRMIQLINGDQTGNQNNGNNSNNNNTDNNDNTPAQTEGTLANGKPITTENVLEILDQIKEKYPDGSTWGDNTAYSAIAGEDMVNLNKQFKGSTTHTYGSVSLRLACGGFAAMVSETIFGRSGFPFRQVTNAKDVRPGDIAITLNTAGEITHYAVVCSNPVQASNGMWLFAKCSGNVGGKVVWEAQAGSTIKSTLVVFTRYPD